MLKPAVLYKEQLEKCFANVLYTEPYFYYTGYRGANSLPSIQAQDDYYQFAIVSENDPEHVIGYFAYHVDQGTDSVDRFGLFSFDPGNLIVPKSVLSELEKLISIYRRVEWRLIGGNPIEKHYDAFCNKYHGNKVTLHAVTKGPDGKYCDEHIYEIVKQ